MEVLVEEVMERQKIFSRTFVLCFMRKLHKYQDRLQQRGVHTTNCVKETSVRTSCSFDEDIELVLKQNSSALTKSKCKSFWKIGPTFSAVKLFTWVYGIVKRTKAARILSHIDYIDTAEIETMVTSVAMEISVAYEYQLCMLHSNEEVVRLAQHGVDCVLSYLNSADAEFTQAGLLSAILEIKPCHSNSKEVLRTKDLSFQGRSFCYRWKLQQIFKQPGLRIQATKSTCQENGSRVTMTTCESKNNAVSTETIDVQLEDKSSLLSSCNTGEIHLQNIEEKSMNVGQAVPGADETLNAEKSEDKVSSNCVPLLSSTELLDPLKDDPPPSENQETVFVMSSACAIADVIETRVVDQTSEREEKSRTDSLSSISVAMDTDHVDGSQKHVLDHSLQGYDNLGHLCNTDDELDASELLNEDGLNRTNTTSCDIKNDIVERKEEITAETDIICEVHNSLVKPFCSSNADVTVEHCVSGIYIPQVQRYDFYGCFTPFGAKCKPRIYGFRGPLHVCDSVEVKLVYNDSVTLSYPLNRQIPRKPSNLHQAYQPKTTCQHP